jgi:uncharacterized RDD family membrane protein YckC
MNWYYAQHGQQIGPVTDEQLSQLFQVGTINQDTLVWREGMPDWRPYREAVAQPNQPEAGQPPASGALNPPNQNEVVCAECGKVFPASETIRVGKASVCAACKPVFLQKLSEGARINTGELNYAGFWIRFAAKFVDGLILGVPFLILYFVAIFPMIASSVHNHGKPPQFGLLPALIQFGFIFVRMAYDIFFLGKYGATPGKMACKLKVVTGEGEKIGYGRATGRFFSEILSGMICYIGYIMVAFDDQKRALHDHICNTRVIYK